MSSQPTTPNTTQDSQRFITLINFVLLSSMFSCLAFITNHFIGIFYPEWIVTGLPVLAFVISFEGLLLLYIQTRVVRHGSNPVLTLAAEWILILLIGKLFLMLQPGAGNFWEEILSWQDGFLTTFFDVPYILLIFFLFVIWGLTRIFSPPLYQLEEDQELMEQEKLGVTFNDRQDARRSLMGLVFVIGFIMVGMTVIIKGNFQYIPLIKTPTRAFVIALMTYFALAFIFLSLNQFAILKARWYFNDIQVNTDLSKRWLLFTVVFIAIIILLTVFLPTDFAFGFLPVAQTPVRGHRLYFWHCSIFNPAADLLYHVLVWQPVRLSGKRTGRTTGHTRIFSRNHPKRWRPPLVGFGQIHPVLADLCWSNRSGYPLLHQ